MAEDNPFLSFFESIGTGMEASQQRRTLMERAQRGEDVDVPGRFATVMSAIARASTPASTRQAQDKLKLETAKFALEKSLGERKQAALELKTLADLELAKYVIVYRQAERSTEGFSDGRHVRSLQA
jgi:hypothetical protein